MIQAISAGGAPASILDRISYTGDYLYSLKYMDGVLYHLLTLESSGTLTVTGEIVGDVWMCGGGQASQRTNRSVGGNGGYTANVFGIALEDGLVAIGAGGQGSPHAPGGTTSYLGYTADGGSESGGGSGHGAGVNVSQIVSVTEIPAGQGQGTTTRPFESMDMDPQCGGGGSGAAYRYNSDIPEYWFHHGADGGSDGANGSPRVLPDPPGSGTQDTYGGKGGEKGGGGGASQRCAGNNWRKCLKGGSNGSAGARYNTTGNFVGSNQNGGGFGYGGGGGGPAAAAASFGATEGSLDEAFGTPGAVMIRIPV